MYDSRICYNDEPVLEINGWRVLCPNMYGKKYKGLTNPILIHKCAKYAPHKDPEEQGWRDIILSDRPRGNPQCGTCNDPIPDEIQGLLALYHWDASGCDGG